MIALPLQEQEFAASDYRSRNSEARMIYDNQYLDALTRIGSKEVVDAMVERFSDPAWEEGASRPPSAVGREVALGH